MSFEFLIMLALFFIFMFMGFPISYSMIVSSLFYVMLIGESVYIILQPMFMGVSDFILLAIPFFILAGDLMNYSGTGERLLNFANLIVGRLTGGLGFVNVLASMLFGGCSGSALADIGGLGPMEIKMMTEGGYSRSFSTALTVSSSIQGALIPPSINLAIVGAVSGVSIGSLLLGGAIPGVLIGVAQMVWVYFYAKRNNIPRFTEKVSFKNKLITFAGAIPFLLMPAIILGGIFFGMFTPTEASAVACFYGFILTFIVKRNEIKIKDIIGILQRVVNISAPLFLIIAGSKIFSWIIIVEGVPEIFNNFLLTISGGNHFSLLLIINILLLIWGMFLDSIAAILILVPLLLPIVAGLGVDPIHFGVFFTVNVTIGLITPPYGAGLIIGEAISGVPTGKIIKDLFPLMIACVVVLLIVTYVPFLSLWLPSFIR